MELNKTVAIGIAASITSLAVGSVAGYFVAKRRLENKYEEMARQEIAEARVKFRMFYKRDEYSTPPARIEPNADEELERLLPVFNEAVAVLKNYDPSRQFNQAEGTNGYHLAVDDIPRSRNVFEEESVMPVNEEDTQEHLPVAVSRVKGHPYVISFAEFDAGEQGYPNITLTYYADGALVEEGDRTEELTIAQDLIGEENLKYIGWEKEYPNVVYIRNDRMRVDYEVIYDERRFGVDMLGLADDSDFLAKVQELSRARPSSRFGPRARFSQYRPGGVVGAAGE